MTDKNNADRVVMNTDGVRMDSEIQPLTSQVYPKTIQSATCCKDRFAQGRDLESRVYRWLCSKETIRAVAPAGVEYQFPESFCKVLRACRSDEVKAFCAIPDFVCIKRDEQVIYVECKNSRTIEKNVWLSYYERNKREPVMLLLEVNGKAYLQRLSRVKFQDSADYTKCYQDPFTIDDDGWITSGRNTGRSGMPCKAVDLSSMSSIDLGEAAE